MQRDIIVKGRSLGGVSDLTLLAPITPGFVGSLESMTYKTRVKRVLETLHGARAASHEHALVRLLSDSVERVGAIHSVRVAVLEPEDKVLLAVTFDGSWQSYIRVLWEKVGALLDLIFCGTLDYVTAHDHSFDEWLTWARRVQVETGFFYGPPEFTARDVIYQRRIERMRQRGLAGDLRTSELSELRAMAPSAEEAVERVARATPRSEADEPPATASSDRMAYERFRNGFEAMRVLYRLTDFFRPGTRDGDVLKAASVNLLREFVKMWEDGFQTDIFEDARCKDGVDGRFRREMDWLLPAGVRTINVPRATPPFAPRPAGTDQEVQGGILSPYIGVTHGAVLLMRLEGAAAAEAFLQAVGGRVAKEDPADRDDILRNVAFTPAGLRACGLTEDELEQFSEEFRQGMAERAGLLGDVRNNHPRRWRLPKRLVALGEEHPEKRVDMGSVHVVLQLRCRAEVTDGVVDVADEAHPLHSEVKGWCGQSSAGVHVLAVQSLKRQFRTLDDGTTTVAEHFGYADGESEPSFDLDIPRGGRIHLGEAVIGHSNAADLGTASAAATACPRGRMGIAVQRNGSYLVLRKYRQFPKRLAARVAEAACSMAGAAHVEESPEQKAYRELVYAKLMGRRRDGKPLVDPDTPGSLNDFTYDGDPNGAKCPLHAHVRRANPRLAEGVMARPPRLLRRSMPYGPYADPSESEPDCGLVFMAYNASLGEQFEVIQRWLVGGNSTGSSSGESCPITGVPESGVPRHARFEYDDAKVFNMPLEEQTVMFKDPQPVTRLEWGLYAFAPSLPALDLLLHRAAAVAAGGACCASAPWNIERGREILRELREVERQQGATAAIAAWKEAIEDPERIDRLDSAALWAALREDHGGVLRTPCGVLVARRDLVAQVYLDAGERYSVCGQMDRMRKSIGEIALGEDAGPKYDDAANPVNDAIMHLDPVQVFGTARAATEKRLKAIRDEAIDHAGEGDAEEFEVTFDAKEIVDDVLAALSEDWFGIQGSKYFQRGAADWGWEEGDPPIYPGQFTALSRYMFQPNPGPVPCELGQAYGRALTAAMLKFVKCQRPDPPKNARQVVAPIARAIFEHPTQGKDDEFVAKTMVGVLMGFTPTITGAIFNVLREWYRDGTFWTLRARCAVDPIQNYDDAGRILHAALRDACRMRPMPQIGWRTARKPDRLGGPGPNAVDIAVGDKVVLAMVSGTQQSLEDGQEDGRLMFGGVRNPEVPHPTHACPGYVAGIAAMLGTLTALLMWRDDLRQAIGPLSFQLAGSAVSGSPKHESAYRPDNHVEVPMKLDSESRSEMELLETHRAFRAEFRPGEVGGPAPEEHLRRRDMLEGADEFSEAARALLVPAVPQAAHGVILAWGDSWLDFQAPIPYFQNCDLVNALTDLGYSVNEGGVDPDDFCNYQAWLKIGTMAAKVYLPDPSDPNNLVEGDFLKYLRRKLKAATKPRAILLSGGGNDSVGHTLEGLLNEGNVADPINHGALTAHIALLQKNFGTVVDAIRTVLDATGNPDLPILVHGYDYPIPFFKTSLLDPANLLNKRQAPWLQDPLIKRGYKDPNSPNGVNIDAGKRAMHDLIEALNVMLRDELPKGRPNVRYVKLTGQLEEYWDGNERPGWHNNLHPNVPGFKKLAQLVADAIEAHAPVAAPQ